MRFCKSIPGDICFDMDVLRTFGIDHIKKFIELMGETLDESPHVNDSIGPKGKERLIWICSCLDDKIEEIEECYVCYLDYVNGLEAELKALKNKAVPA